MTLEASALAGSHPIDRIRLTASARPAVRDRIAALLAHGAMLVAMWMSMSTHHDVDRMLASIVVLVTVSIFCARRARTDPVFREIILDFGAMTGALLALLPDHAGLAGHDHSHAFPPGQLPVVAVLAAIGAIWLVFRVLLSRRRLAQALPSGFLFVLGFIAMAFLQ